MRSGLALLSTFAIVGCRRRLAVAEAPRPQPSSNKFETVFGSNGALLGLGIIKASFASALDFRYLCTMVGGKQMEWILAPMDGVTDFPYRNAWMEVFGPYAKMHRSVAPFVTLVPGSKVRRSHLRDLWPENNRMEVEPQILGNEAEWFLPMAEALHDMGYVSVNWNLGCPVRQVARKQRGSGLLPYPGKIADFLDKVLPSSPLALSVKVRTGYFSAQEIFPVMEVLNAYPLQYVAVHPRIGLQLYKGMADWDMLDRILPLMEHVCVYSGDIDSVAKADAFCARFPSVREIMIGRGMIADPFLPCRLSGYVFVSTEERFLFKLFVEALLRHYWRSGLPEKAVLQRQKMFWSKFSGDFVPTGAFGRIKSLDSVKEYVQVLDSLFEDKIEHGFLA